MFEEKKLRARRSLVPRSLLAFSPPSPPVYQYTSTSATSSINWMERVGHMFGEIRDRINIRNVQTCLVLTLVNCMEMFGTAEGCVDVTGETVGGCGTQHSNAKPKIQTEQKEKQKNEEAEQD